MKYCFGFLVLALMFSVSTSAATHTVDTKKAEFKKSDCKYRVSDIDIYHFSPFVLTETAEVKIYGNVVKPTCRKVVTEFVPTKFHYPLPRDGLMCR